MSLLMRSIFPLPHKRSSAIVGLGHDRRTSTLAVRWRSGNVSFHHRVPRELFAEFLGADSLGRFFRERVRGKFTKIKFSQAADGPGSGVVEPYSPGLADQVPDSDCSRRQRSQTGNPEARFNLQNEA